MDVRKRFDSVQKWWKPVTEEHEKAFEFLKQWVKVIFMNTEFGIRLADVDEYLKIQGVVPEMFACIGFNSVEHFLFHCDDILEVRAKKVNGVDLYFLFLNEELRPPGKDFKPRDLSPYNLVKESYGTTKLCSFSRILNLGWNVVTPTMSGPMRSEQDNPHFLDGRRTKDEHSGYASASQCDRIQYPPPTSFSQSSSATLPSSSGSMYPTLNTVPPHQATRINRAASFGDHEARRYRARFGKLFVEACASLKGNVPDKQ